MATFPCSAVDFKKAFCEFQAAIETKNSTQEGIANMHKCLVLHYIGLENVTDDELDSCASWLRVATNEAQLRGGSLQAPDLG